jgi:WD40 repeat protein
VWLLWHPLGAPAWDLGATTGDGRVYAWNAQSGALIYSNQVAASVLAAYPMADLRKLVLLKPGQDAPYVNGPLYSYDLQTHQTDLIDKQKFLTIPQTSPDGRLFAYVSANDQVKVWDAATQQTQLTVTLPEANASDLTLGFSPDSRWLALARTEGEGWARVYDVSSGQPMGDPLAGYSAGAYKIGFSADSKSLVTYGKEGTAKIWNVATGREMVSRLPVNRFLTFHWYWTALPPDGNSVVESAGEDAIRVIRLPTLAEIDALEKGQMKSP